MKHFSVPAADAHTHLADSRFSAGFEAVVSRALSAGVDTVACCSSSPDDWDKVLALQSSQLRIYRCIGVHPWHSGGNYSLELLERKLSESGACLGETGLDHSSACDVPSAVQEKTFASQLDIAARLSCPVVIHCVRAWGRTGEILSDFRLKRNFMLHYFGGGPETVSVFAPKGAYFSFAFGLLDPARRKSREALKAVPLDRLLFETDSPYPVGRPWQSGLIGEPADLPAIIKCAANILGMEPDELARVSRANAELFFGGTENAGK